MNFIAALSEAVSGKKHVIVLKPLMSKEDPTKFRKKFNEWEIVHKTNEAMGLKQPLYTAADHEQGGHNYLQQWQAYNQRAQELRETPEWKAMFNRIRDKAIEHLPPMRSEKRVIEADYITPLDDATMTLGINPGTFISHTRGFHGNQLSKKRRQTDIYGPIRWDERNHDYAVTRKFERILTVNVDNIESIDGKPVMGGASTMDKGVKHLEDEPPMESRINEAVEQQPQQPKKYRIVMRAKSVADRAEETEEKGFVNPLPARNATVIDADHIAPMLNDPDILLVGIGPGKGQTRINHIHTPQPHPDFYGPITHTPYGRGCKGRSDPSHSDYVIKPKFETILTIHLKNIATINGKPVMYTGDTGNKGVSHLGQFDEWTIDNISDLLEG